MKPDMKTQDMSTVKDKARNRILSVPNTEQVDVWCIYGEKESPLLSGTGPLLDIVQGKFKDVVEYALTLKHFFTWGYGGNIRESEVKEIKKISPQG